MGESADKTREIKGAHQSSFPSSYYYYYYYYYYYCYHQKGFDEARVKWLLNIPRSRYHVPIVLSLGYPAKVRERGGGGGREGGQGRRGGGGGEGVVEVVRGGW